MKFCKTLIASALAAASIAPAFAEIAMTYSTTGSELFLVVRATAGGVENTFVKDLGITFQDFLPNDKFALDGDIDRRGAATEGGVRIGAACQQQTDDSRLVGPYRFDQGRAPAGAQAVGVRAFVEQRTHIRE